MFPLFTLRLTSTSFYDEVMEWLGVRYWGSTGTVGYPTYMSAFYQILAHGVDTVPDVGGYNNIGGGSGVGGIFESLDTVLGAATPFAGETAYDPDTPLADLEGSVDTLLSEISALDPETDIPQYITTAISKATDVSKTAVEEAVNKAYALTLQAPISDVAIEFEDKERGRYNRSLNRLTAGAAVNNMFGSTLPVAFAILEASRNRGTRDFQAQISLDTYRSSIQNVISLYGGAFSQTLASFLQQKVTEIQLRAQATEIERTFTMNKIDAKIIQTERDIILDVEDSMWYMNAYKAAFALSSPGSGTGIVSKEMNTTQKVISGAASGALMGAQVGGPIGAVIGGTIGGISGGFVN